MKQMQNTIGLWIMVFLFTVGVLCAQDRSDIALYVYPATGGSEEARAFFDENIPTEIKGAHYGVVDTLEESNFNITMNLSEYEDEETPGVVINHFTLGVIRTADGSVVVELSWDYHELEEMYQWNLYLVYNALANITLPDKEPEVPEAEEPETEARRRDNLFLLGLRAGASFSGYSFQAVSGYETGSNGGLGGEGHDPGGNHQAGVLLGGCRRVQGQRHRQDTGGEDCGNNKPDH